MLVPHFAFGKLEIPKNLSQKDREAATEVLGYGSAPKILGNPYSLGGYSGIEIGMTSEIIPTTDLSRLGSKSTQQADVSYNQFTIGKGLYRNIDTFLQFGMVGGGESISSYGGQLRWNFFEAEYVPAFMTLVLSASSMNFQNLIITRNQSSDFVLGVSVDDVTLFLGGGLIQSQGTFMGGANGVTDTSETLKESVSGAHYLAGMNVKFSNFFLAMEIDRYTQSTYSGKIGFRF